MFIHSPACFAIAGICAVVAIGISLRLVWLHLAHYNRPTLQKSIVRIVLIVPIYSLISFVSLLAPGAAPYVDTIRDVYEAYVVYLFLILIVNWCGGDSACASDLARIGSVKHFWPFCNVLPRITLGQRFLRLCKQGCLQFVICKPVFAVISLILLACKRFEEPAYQWILLFVYNVSYTWALAALWYLYMAVAPLIAKYSPIRKFLALKVVVFATYWQSLGILALPRSVVSKEDAALYNDFVLSIEFVCFALLHTVAFSYKDFERGPGDHSQLVENILGVVSVKDVVQDARNNFGRQMPLEGYRGVALLDSQDRSVDVADYFVRPTDVEIAPDYVAPEQASASASAAGNDKADAGASAGAAKASSS